MNGIENYTLSNGVNKLADSTLPFGEVMVEAKIKQERSHEIKDY